MNAENPMKASCLCGSVEISVNARFHEVDACHCSMCRKWAGGPMMALYCGQEVTVDGGENVSVYDSSPWGERAFCSKCGSNLYFRVKESNDFIVPAGIFEKQDGFVFTQQIFIDKKPEFYAFANKTSDLTEQQFNEKY